MFIFVHIYNYCICKYKLLFKHVILIRRKTERIQINTRVIRKITDFNYMV